jgi:hypothetical protein
MGPRVFARRKVSILWVLLVIWLPLAEAAAQGWYNSSWLYRKKITIDHTKVGSAGAPHANFPVLINRTDVDLSSHARTDGFDILFTSSDGTTKLNYQREKYTSGTGGLVAWVQEPSLSSTTDTDLYMYYGNSSATDQQNATGTWDSNFNAVWHLGESTGGAGASKDATSNGNDGTPQGTQANLGVTSIIDGGITLNGSNDYISTTTQYSNPQTLTVSIWFNTTSAGGHKMIGFESNQTGTGTSSKDRQIWVGTDGKVRAGVYNSSIVEVATSATYTDGNWHYAVFTHASNTLTLYIDGVSAGSAGTSGAQNYSGYFRMGSYKMSGWTAGSNGYFGGSIDEARVSFTARSDGWILTEYNNQNSPSTFYSVGTAEQNPLPIQLASYTASVVRDNDVEVTWKTVSETNNYGFEIYRKRDGTDGWLKIAFVNGHGTTLAPQSYSYLDQSVPFGTYYYRIKQIDLDGKSETFPTGTPSEPEMEVMVGVAPGAFVLTQNYPNPFNPTTTIEFAVPQNGRATIKVYNVLGQEVATMFDGEVEAGRINKARLNASHLPSGMYFYTLRSAGKVETRRMLLMK